MNIFYLNSDPVICAQQHADKHTIKMILEYSQLLSTAHRVIDGIESTGKSATGRMMRRWVLPDDREGKLYKATHINHPSAIWVRKSYANYVWLWKLLDNLCSEYTYRYGKVHKCQESGLVEELMYPPTNISNKLQFTEPTPAMPDEVKVKGDSVASYRNYYYNNKKHLWSWSGKINSRERPRWLVDMILDNLSKINKELELEY